MNLNYRSNEYELNSYQTDEVIRLYGVPVKLMVTEKKNVDLIFGDWSHIKVDNKNVFEVYVLPENSDEFESYERLQTQFNIISDTSINLFVSSISIDTIFNIIKSENSRNELGINNLNVVQMKHSDLINSIILLPSGKLLEITEIIREVPGANNMFTFKNDKNCLKFVCRSYIHNPANDVKMPDVIDSEPVDVINYEDEFNNLNKYFDELVNDEDSITNKQDDVADDFVADILDQDSIFNRF